MLAGILDGEREVPWQEALASDICAGVPLPILQAIETYASREHDLISASQLCGCLRQAYLKRRVDYYTIPGSWLPMMMGTLVHEMLASGNGNDLREIRLQWTTANRIKVTGHADHFDLSTNTLSDFKTTRWLTLSRVPYGTHGVQLNVYRWLLLNNEIGPQYQADSLQVVYVDLTGPGKQHQGIVICPVEVWGDDRVEAFITGKAGILRDAQAGILPKRVSKNLGWMCRYCPDRVRQACEER